MAKKIRSTTRAQQYVPMEKLSFNEQIVVRERYPYTVPWIPDRAYLYPVDSKGKLMTGRRRGPSHDEAVRLKAEYDVQEVMDS